jgi:hypothetical protein
MSEVRCHYLFAEADAARGCARFSADSDQKTHQTTSSFCEAVKDSVPLEASRSILVPGV